MRYARRTGVVGLAVAGLLLAGIGPAQALPEEALASGTSGSVDATRNGTAVHAGPLAVCDTQGSGTGTSASVVNSGFFEFGPSSTTCALNGNTGVANAHVHGNLFRLDALRSLGGPRIRMTDYNVNCSTTQNGSSASWQVGGLSGISVPPEIPPNYVVTVPGRTSGAPPMAKVTMNETVVPDPPDGSMTVNIMHIVLFPQGGNSNLSGEIVVGSASCSPY